MDYTALYRKYRPRRFADLVGQEHIARTLLNATKQGKVAHAYLFCGPRGTGKTSAAQIMSRAVNCLEPVDNEPCGKCEACARILSGSSLDILEIDAASNRGIDEMRDLRERVKYTPAQEKYKVYIIDEVHMLTTEAFNALLKTLEEPPSHVIFILATTEPHKVPVTVISRCQRFDFHRIGQTAIVNHLANICRKEQVEAMPEALELIARRAEGGLRDAISLLDQCIIASEQAVTLQTISQVLGIVDESFVAKMAVAVAEYNAVAVMKGVDILSSEGRDLRQFLQQLLEYVRQQLLYGIGHKNKATIDSRRALQMLRDLVDGDQKLKTSLTPRLTLEIALLTACRLEQSGGKQPAVTQTPGRAAAQQQPKAAPILADGQISADLWKAILLQTKKESVVSVAYMKMAKTQELQDKTLVLGFATANRNHQAGVEDPENKSKIELAVSKIFGKIMNVATKELNE
ncbi:MAG: DNA polymerase III subunit gamma/tau [Bacillota bacterium]|jgi:DNA polymerase-3 subunit gamma/tau